jgi:chromosome segregation ATPase
MYRAILLTAAALATFGSSVRADNGEEHVRITEDGTKVVDYLADLEADNDVLKRQVMALQNELEHRASQPEQKTKIEVVERKVPVEVFVPDPKLQSALKERESRLKDLELVIKSQKADLNATNERNQQLAVKVGEKDRVTADQQQKIQALRNSEVEYSRQLKEYKDKQLQLQDALNRQQAALNRQEAAQSALMEQQVLLTRDLEAERLRSKQEGDKLKQEEDKLKSLQSKVAQYEKQLDGEVDRRRQIEEQLAQEKIKVASLNSLKLIQAPTERQVSSRVHKVETDARPVEAQKDLVIGDVRSRLSANAIPKQIATPPVSSESLKDILAVQEKLRMRDELFRNYQNSKPPVIVRPSQAISRDGNSITDLENTLRNTDSSHAAPHVRRSLREIEAKLDEDIGIIQRLTRK